MRATMNTLMRIRNFRSAVLSAALLVVIASVMTACGELTGPTSPSTPTDVHATLATANSAVVTWTPSPKNDGVVSYTVYRNGTRVGEATTPTFTDTGLAQQTTFVYSVAANCKSGVISDRSLETAASTVTTVDITPPHVVSTIPVNGATGVSRAGTSTVLFSEQMDPTTITTSTFNIRITSSGQILPGTVTYNAATRVAEFIPTSALPNATQLTVTVTTGVKDLAGNAMTAPFTASWTTRDEEGPTVVSSVPAQGATGVLPTATISVTFSENVDATTITAANIFLRLTSGGANVPGTLSFNAGTRTATFTPSSPLTQGAAYSLTVNGVKDVLGNAMPAQFVLNFTVGDSTPPTVSSVLPIAGATGVATNTTVQVTFSEPMDQSTIIAANLQLKNTATNAVVPATVTYNAATNTATLTPTALSSATQYTLTVSTAVKDVAGNPLSAPFVSTFTTAPLPDSTAPTVVSRTPSAGATNVAINTTVTITFSEPMDAATITAANIKLATTSPVTAVAATVTYNTATNTATLTPTSPLANNTNYTITVTTGVTDVAGNHLAAQFVSTFTTVADTTSPTVLTTSPANGTTVAAPGTITVTFSEDMDASTIAGAISVKKTSDSSPVAGTVSYNTSTRTATFTPTTALAASSGYTVTVATSAKDLAGNGLAGTFVFSFNTSP